MALRYFEILGVSLVVVLSVGCGRASQVTEAKALELLNAEIARVLPNFVAPVVSVTKKDGLAREENGVRKYRMDYVAVYEFKEEGCHYPAAPPNSYGGPYIIVKPLSARPSADCSPNMSNFVKAPKGTKLEMAEAREFELAESGWRLTGIPFSMLR